MGIFSKLKSLLSKNLNNQTDIDSEHLVFMIANSENLSFLKSLVNYQVETLAGEANLLEIIESSNQAMFKIKAGTEGLKKIMALADTHQLDIRVTHFDQSVVKTAGSLHLLAGLEDLKKIAFFQLQKDKVFDSGYKRYHQQFKQSFKKEVYNLAGYKGMKNIFKIHNNQDLED